MNTQLTLANLDQNSVKQQLLVALSDKKIMAATAEDLLTTVSGAIEQAIFYLGLNKNDTDRDMLKDAVVEDCIKEFKSLTLSEITLAIKKGVRREYGDVFGIAPKDVHAWLSAYRKDALRMDAVKELAANDEINRTPTEDEERLIAMNALNNAWCLFKETGSYVDHGNTIYNILDINGKFSFTKEEKKMFMTSAKSRMLDYYAPEKHLGNDIKMKEMMVIYAQVKGEDSNIRVIGEAKRLALQKFFERLQAENKQIWDLFKQ